ncbi:MAG: hypothetical protein ACLT3G_04805 [Acutalibacteraceae bacterium]
MGKIKRFGGGIRVRRGEYRRPCIDLFQKVCYIKNQRGFEAACARMLCRLDEGEWR